MADPSDIGHTAPLLKSSYLTKRVFQCYDLEEQVRLLMKLVVCRYLMLGKTPAAQPAIGGWCSSEVYCSSNSTKRNKFLFEVERQN